MGKPFFSLDLNDFKKWMSKQKDDSNKYENTLVGKFVESKISAKRCFHKMISRDGDLKEMAIDFKTYGGLVIDEDKAGNILIEVDSGSFKMSKTYVREMT